MKRLEKRVAPSWHYESMVEVSKTSPSFKIESSAPLYWFRSAWIAQLLEGDVNEAGGWFKPLIDIHAKHMNWDEAKVFWSFQLPSRALYWLFTLFVFDKPELAEAIELAKARPSRFVRDAHVRRAAPGAHPHR